MLEKERWHDGLVVSTKADKRSWVMLYINKNVIDSISINATKPGFYCFGGMWYGNDPYNHKSYGKIVEMKENEIYFNGVIENYNVQELKHLVD